MAAQVPERDARSRRHGRPREAFGPVDEERDDVEVPLINVRGGFAVEKVRDRGPLQRKVVVASEADGWREIDPPFKPRLHLVDPAAFHLNRVGTVEDAQIIVHRLGDRGVGLACLHPNEECRGERHGGDQRDRPWRAANAPGDSWRFTRRSASMKRSPARRVRAASLCVGRIGFRDQGEVGRRSRHVQLSSRTSGALGSFRRCRGCPRLLI